MTSQGFNTFKPHELKEEIFLLWAHWKCLTIQTQTYLAHMLKKIYRDFESKFDKETNSVLKQLTEDLNENEPVVKDEKTSNTCFVFFSMLKLHVIREFAKKFAVQKKEESVEKRKEEAQNLKRNKNFQPLNTLLPSLKHYSLMARCYSDRLPYDQEPDESKMYQNPRLFRRGEQLWEAQGKSFTSENKGVLLLTVDGAHVLTGRGLVIANGNNIQYWIRKTSDSSKPPYRGLIGEQQILEQEGKQIEVKQKEKEKEKEKEKDNKGKEKDKGKDKDKQKFPRPEGVPNDLILSYKFSGHSGTITAMSLSYDQLFLLSAATDKVIKLWCLRLKTLLLNFKSHRDIIWSVNFSDSGYFFLTSSADKSVRLWRTDSPTPVRVMDEHKSDVYKADFMKNPTFAVSCSADKTVRMWNLNNGECIRKIKFDKEVLGFSLSFSGRFMMTNQINGTMTLFDLPRGEELNSFNLLFLKKARDEKQTRYPIHDMAFSPDQQKFVCISKKQIAIYSMQALKQKVSTNIYDEIKGESYYNRMKNFYIEPKEILDIGGEMNLVHCKYHSKDYMVVVGTR